jgi:hypothetical protein
MEQPKDKLISATEARALIKQHLNLEINASKMTRLMKGPIPSQGQSALDGRVTLVRQSDVMKWIDKVKQQTESAA